MPALQQHMLRVASVALLICRNLKQLPVDMSTVVAACLLHDMGNILKFDLTRFPEFLEPQGLSHWEKVRDEFKERYGSNEFIATELIAQELRVVSRVKELISSIGFSNMKSNFLGEDVDRKICAYSDMRVDPFGVVSLTDRIADLRKRYESKHPGAEAELQRQEFFTYAQMVEKQLLSQSDLEASDITNDQINGTINSLKSFVVPTES